MAVAMKNLSGSTDGKQIKVAATATPGTTIHTAVASTAAGVWDKVWIYGTNTHTVSVDVTIEWGGTTAPDDTCKKTLAPNTGWELLVDGALLQNSLVVKAFASVANVVLIRGEVNAIT